MYGVSAVEGFGGHKDWLRSIRRTVGCPVTRVFLESANRVKFLFTWVRRRVNLLGSDRDSLDRGLRVRVGEVTAWL